VDSLRSRDRPVRPHSGEESDDSPPVKKRAKSRR
jgi:hypothetical protein